MESSNSRPKAKKNLRRRMASPCSGGRFQDCHQALAMCLSASKQGRILPGEGKPHMYAIARSLAIKLSGRKF